MSGEVKLIPNPKSNTRMTLGTNPGQIIFEFYAIKKLAWYQRLSLFLFGWKYEFNKAGIK